MTNKEYPIFCYNKEGILLDPGEGYRLLKVREQPIEGDEILDDWTLVGESKGWIKIEPLFLEDAIDWNDFPVRRKENPEFKETVFNVFYKTPFGSLERVASRLTSAGAIKLRDNLVEAHIYKPEELEIHEVTTITRKLDV
jgi:hypothetical protein